jgi:CO dehydrogenase/acetyl-CoA synthase gamma subunit (corrinoid Fe-S protein)
MRMGPIDLYKMLPKTNCGDCGQPSCLAFATQVVGYGHELRDCPHLEEVAVQKIEQTLNRELGGIGRFSQFIAQAGCPRRWMSPAD